MDGGGEPGALTHLNAAGEAHMVDVGAKAVTGRVAVAAGHIRMNADALAAIRDGTAKKGDVLAVARIAGIMAAKTTSALIPLCHPIAISSVSVELVLDAEGVAVTARVSTAGQTGVEMEALTAVSVAALTVYDMVKAVEKSMVIDGVRLILKDGGKSGLYEGM